MKSTKKAAYFVLFASLTLGSVTPIQAQQRRVNFPVRSYSPPPAPRPRPERQVTERPEVPRTENHRNARTYNTRPGGIHVRTDYFAANYGREHGFHFARYAGGPCIGDCGFVVFGGEWYFNLNGGWFGVIDPLPGNWAFQTDYLYIDVGDDGNYYLYDAAFPDVAVQLTFVQNVGDDQACADDSDGDDQAGADGDNN
jgi:hypothetical protein